MVGKKRQEFPAGGRIACAALHAASSDESQYVSAVDAGLIHDKPSTSSRVDEIDDAYRLLVVSASEPTKPDWCPYDCFKTRKIPEDFFAAGRYRFSLLVNPTKKLVVRDEAGGRKKNGRRIPLTKREDLVVWIQRKAVAGGFEICDPGKTHFACCSSSPLEIRRCPNSAYTWCLHRPRTQKIKKPQTVAA